MNNFGKNLVLWIIIGILLVALFNLFQNSTNRSSANQKDYSEFVEAVERSQVANVTLADAHTIAVQPWEKKMVQVVEKALRDSDLGINPATSGDVIRVPMPALTEERRKELVKVVHKEAEATRVAVRNIRRDAITHLKELLKAKSVSEDDERRAQDDIQKLTDRYIGEVDKALHAKEADLMAV